MKDGLRVFDADTHVEPTAEVLDKYVDPGFRPRLADLAPYRVPVRPGNPGGAPGRHVYRYGQISYRRILGEAAPRETHSGRDTHWMGSKMPRVGVQDDQAESRVQDMDDEGTDGHFLIPTAWTSLVGHEDPTFGGRHHPRLSPAHVGFFEPISGPAQEHDRRLGARRRRRRARDPRMGQVALGGRGHAARHQRHSGRPSELDPIWRAADEHDLPIAHHSFTWTPPYFPGVLRPVGQYLPRAAASHPWGAMRFIASVIGGGIMDRYPNLRVGTLECGFGWLPFWGRRMDEQYAYVGSTARTQDEAERVPVERPVFLQRRAARGCRHV